MKTFIFTITTALFSICVSAQCDPPLPPGAIIGDDPVCPGSTHEYMIFPVPGATSYVWTLPNGWTGSSTGIVLSAIVGSTGGPISVTAVNNCGSSPAQLFTASMLTATITPNGPTTFCVGGNVVLNANTGQGFTYQWYNGTTPIGGQTNASYTASISGSYKVEVTANNCSVTSTPLIVTVDTEPNVSASSNSPVCSGDPLIFTGNSTTTGVVYNWTGPNNFSNSQNPNIANAAIGDAGTYTLSVTHGTCTESQTINVIVNTAVPATPSPISGLTAFCAYSAGNLYEVTNDPSATTYNWTIPTNWSGSSTDNDIMVFAGVAGNGSISVTAENGCGISAPSTLNVTVHPLPTPVIVQTGNMLGTAQPYDTYQWYNGMTLIAGATSQNYTTIQAGSYSVVVTDANGCVGQSAAFSNSVGIAGISEGGAVSLYPNPNNGSFTIEGSFASNDGNANVVIMDVAGRIVHQQQVSVSKNKLNVRMDMNGSLAAGVYTIKVSSDAANAVISFVKK